MTSLPATRPHPPAADASLMVTPRPELDRLTDTRTGYRHSDMSLRFVVHTSDSAVGTAKDRLADIEGRHGTVGAMVATMAGSPSVVSGYLDLSRAMKRSRLDRAISERISLAVQESLGCELCLEAHTAAARSVGVSDREIELARQGTSADPTIAFVVEFGRRVHLDPSSVTDHDIDRLRSAGFRDRDILDIVGLVALNVLTGTFNLVAGLEPAHATAG